MALMAGSESESESETLSQLKEKVRRGSKPKLEKLLFTLLDDCEEVNAENCMLKDICSELKRDVRLLEKNKQELECINEILISEKLETKDKTLALRKELDKLKDFMNKREKEFNFELSKLESESLDLTRRLESLVSENNQLLEKVHKVESDLVQNRRCNRFSEALNWLNTHHNRNRMGLGFVN